MNEFNLFPGALEDTRPEEEKLKDYKAEEITAFGAVDWKEKKFEDIATLPVRNQDGSGSCVAQTLVLMMGIENLLEEGRFVELSAKDIYVRRSNQGTAGMIGVNALDIARNYGATLEALMPSQNQGESDINIYTRRESDEQIAQVFKIKSFIQLGTDLEKIAWVMESERKNGVAKPIMIWFGFPRSEWTAIPQVGTDTSDIVRHSLTGRDYGMLNGKKGIFIQDSWGLHSSTASGLRFISDDYIKARFLFAAYVIDLNNDWRDAIPPPVPTEKLTKDLKFGMTDPEVKILQDILKSQKLFPENTTSTFYFGSITKKAIVAFQIKYGLTPDGLVGPLTRAKLNG